MLKSYVGNGTSLYETIRTNWLMVINTLYNTMLIIWGTQTSLRVDEC
jgi:hypothetical protein